LWVFGAGAAESPVAEASWARTSAVARPSRTGDEYRCSGVVGVSAQAEVVSATDAMKRFARMGFSGVGNTTP